MKMRHRVTRRTQKRYSWGVPVILARIQVESKEHLPRIGHHAFLYVVKDGGVYRWQRGKWVDAACKLVMEKVNCTSTSLRELEAQPMFKHVTNLPILLDFNFSDIESFTTKSLVAKG